MALHAVILAGGKGERLWPLSREGKPKQLLSFDGIQSLIQSTVDRLLPIAGTETTYVVTGKDMAASIIAELIDIPRDNVLIEPFGCNTAPGIAFAAAWIFRKDPQGTMAVFPSDHIIADTSAFQQTVAFGVRCLERFPKYLLTIGIKPDHPETGYGYIAPSNMLGLEHDLVLHQVLAFHEKPDRMHAETYIDQGFLWNAGMFIWRVDTLMHEFKQHMPTLYQDMLTLLESSWKEEDILRFYQSAQPISIDYAIMEKTANVAVIPADFGWNDVGSWDAVGKLGAKDPQGNAITGQAYAHESGNNVIWAGGKKIVLIGVHDMVVVDGEDAILVCTRESSQDVGKVMKKLKG